MITIVSFTTVMAQNYKPVEVDLGIRASSLTGDYLGGGAGLFLEPRYNINDKMTLGLKLGFDVLVEGVEDTETQTDATLLPYSMLTGDYIIASKKNRRFFAGVGIGFSGRNSMEFKDIEAENPEEIKIGSSFGVVPRIGAKLGIFKISVDYSIYTQENTKNYVGVNLGFSFGGGRRK